METTKNKDADFFESEFKSRLEKVKAAGSLLMAYDGVLNSETISKLEGEIEEKIREHELPKMVLRKAFFICIESLQNMFIHGHTDENGNKFNFFILYLTDKAVKMIGANLIANSAIDKLSKHIAAINTFDEPADLRNYYLEHLEKNELSEKGGAGLGFITIAMKSGNKLHTEFLNINNERSMFLMEVCIDLE